MANALGMDAGMEIVSMCQLPAKIRPRQQIFRFSEHESLDLALRGRSLATDCACRVYA